MDWLINKIAEEKISQARKNGQFEHLPGKGQPLILDDDKDVPEQLRVAYRVLKNAGYLPPELVMRKEALELADLIEICHTSQDHAQLAKSQQKLQRLELKMRMYGIDTRFIYQYLQHLTESPDTKK